MIERRLTKYRHAQALEKDWFITGNCRADYLMAIVIPALAETRHLPMTLATLALNNKALLTRTLIVVVVNQRENSSQTFKQDNQATLSWLSGDPFPQLNIGVVDATGEGFEFAAKDGVGLARKIGFDLSLECLDWDCRPVLISLDADTLVDSRYLEAIYAHFQHGRRGGAVIPFHHQPGADDAQEKAIRCYEHYLRSYLFGLKHAGSPYAYHTIGSAFCCLGQDYIAAGGMNRRQAAEDFYFLQRLAKTSGVGQLKGTVVAPAARFSDRVPFGTGPTLQQHVDNAVLAYRIIGMQAFSVLKDWLAIVSAGIDDPAADIMRAVEGSSVMLGDFLTDLDFLTVWEKLQKNYPSSAQRLAAFHIWFDALRTRQLLTRCSDDEQSAAVVMVGELLRWGGERAAQTIGEQLAILEGLQGVSPAGEMSNLTFQI